MQFKLLFPLIVFMGLLASCAHHRDVRPGADGVHRVAIRTDDKGAGSRDAIEQANHYCEQYKRSAAFLEEDQKYTGDMDEDTYKKTKTAGKVAKAVGGTAWVLGGQRESNLGGLVGLGGIAADTAAGEGYTVTMKFKCQ